MKTLSVKEIFATLQGEGSQTGTPSVFVRFAGCNLWSGLEKSRGKARGICGHWCDTDFVGGTKMEILEIVEQVRILTKDWKQPHVTITGGEPCLQLRRPAGEDFVEELLMQNISVAVETNGTTPAAVLNDPSVHVTVSPKQLVKDPQTLEHIKLRWGTDLKVIHPQWSDANLETMRRWDFRHWFIQPLDTGCDLSVAPEEAIAACRRFGYRLSLQTHKMIGVP